MSDCPNEIHVTSVSGNFYEAKEFLNKYCLGDYLIQLDFTGGNTLIVLNMPKSILAKYKKERILR